MPDQMKEILDEVAAGRLSPEEALQRLDAGSGPADELDRSPSAAGAEAEADSLNTRAEALEARAEALQAQADVLQADVERLRESSEVDAEAAEERVEAIQEEAERLQEEAEALRERAEEDDEPRRSRRRVRINVASGEHALDLSSALRPALNAVKESLASIGPLIKESIRESTDVHIGRSIRMTGGAAATAVVEQSVPAADGLPIIVDSDAGSIEMRATDTDVVRVVAEKHAPHEDELASMDVSVRADADAVRIEYRSRDWPIVNRWVAFRIEAPASALLQLQTGAGAVQAEGFHAGTKIRTGGGPIRIGRMSGEIEVRTSGGQVRAEDISGTLDLKTSGGSIDLHRASLTGRCVIASSGGQIAASDITGDALEATTAGGGIEVSGVIAGECKLHTAGGSIRASRVEGPLNARTAAGSVTVEGRLSGESTIRTSAGSIDIRLPEDSRLRIRARGHSASNDFGLSVQRGTIDGVLGDGGEGSLDASADLGSVSIRKL
jgi:hypothetical protein